MLRCKQLIVPLFNVFLMLGFFLLGTQEANATHAKGVDVSYVCLGPTASGMQYALTLNIYRDCNGINLPTRQTISYTGTGTSGGTCTGSVSSTRQSITDITPNCSSIESSCTQSDGTNGTGAFGVEQHVYTATITIPLNCTDIYFSWNLCCRNNAITTLVGSPAMYAETRNIFNTQAICNNSPIFLNPPASYTCVNQEVFYNHGAIDYDGDSLNYSLIPCLEGPNNIVPYRTGYSGAGPFGNPPGGPVVNIDAQTGAINFTPTSTEVAVLCVLVEEYRNGVLIGSTMRDIQFEVLNCSNANPILSGVNNSGQGSVNFITTTCFGSQLCFDIVGSDPPNPGDVLSMTYDQAIPNSTFTVSGPGVPSGNQITGTFCWTPTAFDIGTSTFTVTIQDDACPLVGSNTFTYIINVIANPNDPVDAGLDASVCVGDCTPLSATTISPNGVSYAWSPTIGLSNPNIPNPVACPPSTTTYSVILTYNDGCTSTDQVTITVEDDPPLAVAPNNINACGGAPLALTATTDAASMNFTFTELPPLGTAVVPNTVTGATATAPVVIPNAPGIYQWNVEVSNPFTSCTSSEIITITVGDSVVPVACRNIYVSTTGIASASGSQFDPVTIQEALRRAACNNSVIKIATGTYNIDTALNITNNLTVEGGFIQGQAWLKTSEIGATTINRTRNNAGGVLNLDRHLTAVEVFGSSFFRLQDLTITTDDAIVPGTSTYGIFMNNASSYNITRVNVEPGNATNGSDGIVGCAGDPGTDGDDGQDGQPDGQDDNVRGGNGGFAGASCGSFALINGGGGGRNADLGNGIGNGANGFSTSATIVDGGGGGGGGRGGNADDGGTGGASGRGGTPLSPPIGCSATGSGLGTSVSGGLGGGRNTLGDGLAFNNGAPNIGQPGTAGIAGVLGCTGTDGAPGLQVACRYTVGSQGATGMSGSAGSGGGGGGGGGGQGGACGCINGTGAAGGGGGGGGAAGLGGTGGFGGGASFGIYMCSNGANGFIEHCHVSAGTAGAGGLGQAGGAGGAGGAAGAGGAGTAAEVQDGGAGGQGGQGGQGGSGGDGQPGIAVNIFWDGGGTIPVAQDSTYELYNQQIIYVENTNCTNADVMFWDSSRIASHPNSTALQQVIPIGLPGTTVTNWVFDAIGLNTIPPTRGFNADTTQYNDVGRYDIIHNTCLGCPAAGGPAGDALEEYRGFHNIAFDQAFKPKIISSANVIGVDTFQLCVGDFATFGSSIFGDTARWEFGGAIPNPGNVQNIPSTQFNVSGFYMIQLFLITDCCGDTPTDTAYLYVDPVPNVVGSGNETVCLGDSALLTIAGLAATDTVIWSPVSDLAFITRDSVFANPTATTTYTASVYSIVTGGGQTRLSCPVSLSYTVTVNPLPNPTMSSTDVVCNNDGTATAAPAVGTYDFLWSNGAIDNGVATSTITNLAPGTYCVTVTNVITGCVDTGCVFVAPAAVVPGVFAANITAVSCAGANDGSVTIGTINGTAPYTYVWDTIVPGIVSPTSVDYTVTGLVPRDYSVTATDNNGCQSQITFNIPTPDPLTIAIIDTTHPVCQNDTGRIEVEGQGGTGLYTYIWSNGTTTATGILSGIDTGFYCVTIVDVNSCTNTFCINLDAQQVLTTAIDISTSIPCNGGTACIVVNATGGSGLYTYSWSGSGITAFTTALDTACNFPADAGAYTVTVTDNTFGCTTTADIFVTEPPLLTTTISSQSNVSCNGDSTGIATVVESGGTTPYTFLWDVNAGNQTNATATNLPAGSYCVTVTDSLNCTSVSCVTITQPATGVDVSASITTAISCFGVADGQATAVGSDGTPSITGYTYTWSTTQLGPILTGGSVTGSPYTVVVRDSLGCEDSTTISFTQPTAVTASIASTVSVTCFGDSTGEATAAGAGGTGAYTFQWGANTGNQTGPTATGLSTIGGPYCVTVTDANNCVDSICINITQPASALTSNAVVVDNANCAGVSDGIALASGLGGTGAISFIWDAAAGSAPTAQVTGLAAGVYCVTVSDANNCSNVHCVTITEPNAVTATISSFTNAACFGDSTGTATVLGSGGNAGTAYTYLWSTTPAQTTATANNLALGVYTVTVSDDSLCTGTASVTISEPSQVTVIASVTSNFNGSQVSCPTASDGSVTANAAGGTGAYTFGWSPGGAGQTLNGVDTGMYIVTATDSNGCIAIDTTVVVPPAPVVVAITTTSNVTCFGTTTGSATANGTGGSGGPYAYVWTDLSTGATNSNLPVGVHCVTVTDINNCPAITCVTITQPSAAVSGTITIDSTISCNNGSDGGIHVVATGGTPFAATQTNGTGYTYLWSNGSTDTSSVNLGVGQHCVTITDTLGCSFVSCVTLTEPTAVTANISATQDVNCTGDSTGTATVIGSGGTPRVPAPAYSFEWSDGQSTQTAIDLAANTSYSVTVSDANGCPAVTNITLSQPANAVDVGTAVISDFNGQDISCVGASDGSALATGSGGTGSYNFNWGTTTNDTLANVVAGTYMVTITDSLGCQDTASVTLANPPALTAIITAQSDALCKGDSTGSATVTAGGGTGAYIYLWADGQAGATNNNLPNGTHIVSVTDANGCSVTASVTINEPALALTFASVVIDSTVSCNGGSDGGITAFGVGGTGAYSFVWDNGAGTASITGISEGTYCVTVTDANGCTADTCVIMTEPTPVVATITGSTNVSCFGDSTGTATVVGSGGTPNASGAAYSFEWSDGQTTATATGLAANTLYQVTVTDGNLCTVVTNITLIQPVSAVNVGASVISDFNGQDISCVGESDGSALATGSGGSGSYNFDWGTTTNDTLANIVAGTYMVTITDSLGCQDTASVTLVDPPVLTATITSQSNVLCTGDSTGSATVTAVGGTGAYIYLWADGQAGATNNNLPNGTHIVSVTDANGCSVTASVTINEPALALTFASVVIDSTVSCNGGSDGGITAFGVGGTGAYSFVWDNGAGTASITGISEGTYCVTVTDANGCTADTCVIMTEPTPVVATITGSTNVSCFGDSTGTATIVGSGGTPNASGAAYSFEWSDGQTTATATGLAANTLYQVTVTDDNGCIAVTTILLTQPTATVTAAATVNSDYNGQDVSCNGATDGEISVVGSGGTQFTVNNPYTYNWNTTASNDTLTVGAGIYTVTVTDSLGCTAVATVTVNEPVLLTATIAAGQTNVACFGDSTGQATVTPNGGTVVGNYTFVWDNGVTAALNSNLPAGVQCVTVTDANGCFATVCATILEPSSAIIVANATVNSNVSCNGGNDGEATITVSGGTPRATGYNFNWAGLAQTTGNITGLSAGTYCVTITDSLGCAIDTCVIITEPTLVTATIANVNNVSCFGDSTGSARVAGGGGTVLGAYTFLWDANAGNQTTATATGLAANTPYCVTVTDDNGCSATTCVTLTQPTLLTVSGSEVTPVVCAGESNGSVQATATGGFGTLNYTWGANAGGATTDTLTGLAAGVYCVTITDSLGCTAATCITLTEPSAITITTTAVVDVVCRGDSTGEITVTATGGAGGYSFLWGAAAGNRTTPTIAGLAAGTYCVVVTDASGCADSICVTLGQPATAVDVTASVTSNYNGSQIQCFGDSSGVAVASATGGTVAVDYQYAWTITSQTTNTAVGLPDGTFCVTATDDFGCTDTACVIIAEPTPVAATVTATTNIACLGDCTGTATVAGSGGTGSAYTYLWDANAGSQTTAMATNLCTGLYGVTISDINGCVGVATVSISEPSTAIQANAIISSNFNGQDVSCNSAFDGAATASAVGGTPGYTFQWNGAASGQNTAIATGLGANILYCVTITDAAGCMDSACVTLTQPTAIIPTIDTTINVSCFGDSTGAATVSAAGGVAPYIYRWDAATGNQTTPTAIGLAAGSYTVTVIDANGCQGAAVVVVGQPAGLLDVNAIVTSSYAGGTALQCFGDSSGTALATISGGTGPYTQIWGHGPTTLGVNNLTDGTYCLTVTDSLGCMDTACVTLSTPTQVVASLVSTSDASCNGGCDGTARVTSTGGVPGYTYLWDAGAGSQTTAMATGLCAGVYEVSATDANGCIGTFNVTISEPATAVVASAIVTSNYNGAQVSCVGSNDGQATASAVGGAGAYTYVWTNGTINSTLDSVTAGTYCVTVSDANGCSDVACVTITEPSQVTATITTTNNVACLGDSTGSATVAGAGGTAGYTYQWEAAAGGQQTATATNLTAGSYIVTVIDANGCTSQAIAIIGQPNAGLVAGATITNNVQCFGDSSGAAQITILGGTTPYSVVWDHGPTTVTVTGLTDGTYCAIVTDSLGCMDTACVTLLEPTAVTASVTTTPADCRGAATGTATATAGGGTPGVGGYTYEWDANAGGQTTATATGLSAALSPYTVTVTDGNGCTTTASAIITEPATSVNTALVVLSNYNGAQVSCNGSSDAIVGVTLSGGTSPYTYLWSNGTTNDTLTGVGAGQHCVTVTDANGCSDIACITVTQPSLITATIASTNNVACFGQCTGTATVSGTGGTENGTYNVLWDANAASQTTATAINLCVGSYNVTITDDNGCQAVTTVIITQPSNGLATTITATSNFNGQQISCAGASDGELTATVTGGTGAGTYTFAWNSNPSTTNVATGLSVAGNPHCVIVTDGNGCVDTACFNLVDPSPLTASNTQTNVSCNGGSNGTATVVPTGGTGTYTYLWDANAASQTTATATGLVAGPYCVTVEDANGCQVTSCLNITAPTLLTTTATIASNYNGEDVSCNGSNDGIVFTTPTGGTMPYTYAWSTIGAGTADTMTNASAGQVIVIVTDSLGCTATDTVVLTQPTPITASITASTNATCNGQCDGTATATGTGGTVTTGYTFLWSATAGSQTTAIATSLCAGTHTVTVTDNNGCANVTSIIITQPLLGVSASAIVTSNFNGQDVSCNGACNGSATALGAGGTVTTGYTYLWDATAGNQVTDTAFNLCAGVYTVTISDNGGCSNTAIVTITEPSNVVATISSTVSVSCGGGADGQATVTGNGGTTSIAGYTYLWDATAANQTTATAINLPGGVAIGVTVTDNNGCTASTTVTIVQPANALLVNPTVTSDYNGQDISCATVCDGAAQVQVTGGIPGYNITWSTGATVDSITGLCAGTYLVTVTDNGGCTVVDSVVVTEPVVLTAGIITQNNVSCTGGADACVQVGALGGTPGYTYAIQAGVTQANNGLFCNLGIGTYTVTVTDLNFCLTTVGVTITQPATLPTTTASVTSNYNGQDVSCFGACDGILTATPSGGTAPYTYSWSGTTQVTQTVTGMCAGTYSVLITDSLGCTASSVVTITNPAQLTGALTSTVNAACFGDSSGAATFTAGGGTAPYTYSAGGNSVTTVNTSATVTGLVAGGYTATITDANGCIVSVPFIISSPPQLIATATVTSSYQNGTVISCAGTCDGAATAVGVGGVPGSTYNFLWSSSAGGQTTFTATGLCAGSHTVSITDQNGCVAVDTVVLVEPLQLAATSTQVNVNCFGDSTGSIQMTANGGTPIYTYTLSGQTNLTGLFGNLTAGTYCITVRDTNGCSIIECVTINQNTQLQTATFVTSNFNGAHTSCFSSADGVARVNVTGGQATYNYQWSTTPVQNTQIATGLAGGTYFVTVTDNLGCIAIDSVVVTPADSLILSVIDTVHVACFGQPTGSFTVAASGGVGPYLYSFDGGITFTNTVQYTNLPANMIGAGYCVVVRDRNGCETTTCININEPNQLQGLADSLIMVSCFGGADGMIAVTGVGGTAPYLYSFNGGSYTSTRIFNGLSAQNYTIRVQDANGCIFAMTNQIITQPAALILTVDTLRNPTCTGQCDGVIELSALDGTAGYEFSIDGVNYQLSGIFSSLCAGGYTVYVRDAQGCIKTRTVFLTQPTPVVANAAVTSFYPAGSNIQFNVSCFGNCDGTAVATPTGGTASTAGTYTYQWSVGGATTAAVTGLCANTVYTVTVTDINGCTNVDSVILTTPTQLAGVFTQVTPETCAGDDNGVIVVTATSGTGAGSYTYNIGAGPVTNGVFTNLTGSLTGTSYSVTISDANGCQAVLDTLIFEPSSVTILATSGVTSDYNGFDISCFGAADGELTVTHTGGTTPISYLWDVNTGAQTTAIASGLRAGTYCVTVTDNNGCAVDTCLTLTQPTPLTMTATTDSAGCTGTNGGSVSAIPLGGTGVYTYAIDSTGTGPSVFGPDSTWSNLTAGTYVIYVDDQNDCGPVQQTVTVGQGAPIVATINVLTPYNGQQISCNGASDATATVTATGGTVGGIFFTYDWDANAGSQTGSTATGLGAGIYFVTITDTVSNCIEIVTVTVVEPTAVALAVDTIVHVGCALTPTGAFQVTATGGTPGYTYSTSLGAAGTNTTGIFTNLPAARYDVYAIDANGCGDTISVTIIDANPIIIDLDSVNVSCGGLVDGQVIATVTGGTPSATGFGYTVSWTGPSGPITAIDTLFNVPAGTYTMTVLDAAGCSPQPVSITVLEPTPVVVNVTNVVRASCGDSTGSITLTGSGGPSILDGITGAYEFSIDGGTTFSRGTNPFTFNNLASGSYQIVIRDTNSITCIDVENVDLGSNSNITGYTTTTNETCFKLSDGTATAFASSPAGGFTYQWFSNKALGVIFDVNQTATGLTGNLYDVDGNGTIDTAFTYYVIVTDASPCSDTFPAYLLSPDSLTVTASLVQDVSCFGGNDGAATATVNGRDSSAVTFLWNNGATTSFANDLSTMGMDSMAYIVTITDTVGCTSSDTVFVFQPEQPVTGAYTGNTVSCAGNSDGVVSIDSVVGGTAPYLYSFDAIGPYGSDAILSQGLSAGVYTVYTQDANGCIDSTENIIIRDTINYIVTAFMDQTINMGETVTLYGAVNNSGIDSSLVTWSTLDPNTGIMSTVFVGDSALISYTPDTFYTDMQFVLSLNNGCGDSSIVTIEVNQEQTVFVPNAFSPNGDGTNDIFTVYGSSDVSRVKSFMVFDRWGELVHIGEDFAPNSIDPDNGWDGTFRGKSMNPAVFVYFAEVELTNGETVIRKGDVTLIK
jgi:gliding motility-associated-like protein